VALDRKVGRWIMKRSFFLEVLALAVVVEVSGAGGLGCSSAGRVQVGAAAGSTGAAGSSGASGTGTAGAGQGGQAGTGSQGAGSGGGGSTAGSGPDGATSGSGGAGSGGAGDQDAATDLGAAVDGGIAPRRLTCPAGPFDAPRAGASQAICGDFKFKYNWNEGPTWIASQNAFFFSNFVQGASGPGDIIKYTPGGTCETFITDVACNGLTASYDGNLVGVCQGSRAVVEFDINTKAPTTLAGMYMGQLLDSPNDVVAHSNGTIYFTNPTYELGNRPVGVGQAVFRLDPTRKLNLIAKVSSNQPNGIALSPDEMRLYVELDGSGVEVYDLDSQGVPTSGPTNFTGGTDGISVDCAGNLYLSGGGIVSPAGMNIGNFPGGTMAAFGGSDGKTLIVVGSGTGLHIVQMNVPGPAH
jgi:gluconolactonase